MESPCRDCMERTKIAELCRSQCPCIDRFKEHLSKLVLDRPAIDPAGDGYRIIY